MKITILGAGGNIGQRIVKEAQSRNHELNLISSKPLSFFGLENTANATVESADIFETEKLAESFKGSDVVISSYAPPADNNTLLLDASKSLVKAAKAASVKLISVGGTGSLKIDENTLLVDTPDFPAEYKPIAKAHLETLEKVYKPETEANWVNVSPAAYIFEGTCSNQFRVRKDDLLTNEKGESAISMEDFAVGILNEVESPQFSKQRFSLAY